MKFFHTGMLSLVLCTAMLLGALAADSRRHLVQAPAADCVTRLTSLAADCSAQIASITSLGQNIPADATDDQIKAQLAGQPLPDAKCCATAGNFITGGCRCDPQVLTIVQGQNINPASLKTLVKATQLSCNNAGIVDTCK
ncbi:hypothetical protein COCSUDRAFT_44435 [Coccomyxa subellipsoidea C-169]|uniref:Bifunctional inhibitor/plant lipid transfer protein/seed storage helical domain-containing protein n=1 Tax=Coccomyxa subellipsoidea (strain C-169) TaxID=574566 RepID=I0YMF1_COCSC|nr:hypothetical protein COCSUDRAFT_44435 [Coccomyxa subellipsoidea C-169]EIE19570.1 hypothetical protein COCSUDRAFT_44435 [Coccomyxa subellipsoidea C-169]|eukprot:XP_005644114.1 hypothetical protein COCSUDRAFT_44435 [Coccomyxa subellipsoidea C-169]